jgi:hypothetical protein
MTRSQTKQISFESHNCVKQFLQNACFASSDQRRFGIAQALTASPKNHGFFAFKR